MSADSLWAELTAFSDTYTCYSAAVASWAGLGLQDWSCVVNPGLTLTVLEAGDGLFGFAHFPPRLRAELGLVRVDFQGQASEAMDGVLDELARSGRVIVAGDGFCLPWHVAHGKRHVPHWYVLSGTPDRIEVVDPFACRNELGAQRSSRLPIAREQLAQSLPALPGDEPVFELRERLALGDDCGARGPGACQWFVHGEVTQTRAPNGADGADGVLVLAHAMRTRAQSPDAYLQADDIWSIARHRAFLAQYVATVAQRTADQALLAWSREQVEPLAKRWSHMAPLLMQARLSLGVGRAVSGSVADTLEDLADRERAAAQTCPSPEWGVRPVGAQRGGGSA